jgi:hypothetical protein
MTLTRTPSVLHGREASLGDDADHHGCEAALNVAYLALTLWVSVLFFQKRVTFPAMYKVLVMAVLVTPFADWLLVSVGLAQSGRMSFDAAMGSAFATEDIDKAAGGALLGGVWILYLSQSRHVANTFVN